MEEQRECMLHHYRLVVERFGTAKGTLLMRKYACTYAQGKPGAREFRLFGERRQTGVPLADETVRQIVDVGRRVGVEVELTPRA